MRLPRFSLAAAMLGVVLVAVDLAALQYLYSPTTDGILHLLVMSITPMFNALTIVGYRCTSRGEWRGRPFSVGFLTAGLAAMLVHVACDRMFPITMFRLYYGLPFTAFFDFCRDHVPWYLGARADGTAYFRYYALLSLFYCWPQFLVAGLGGLMARWVSRKRRQPLPA